MSKAGEIKEDLIALEKLLDDRVVEYHKVQGAQAERHAFCYYREIVWRIKERLELLTTKEG